MEAGEALVVVGTVNGDVLHAVLFEGCHELVEVFLAAFFTHLGGGEVTVHSGTVPVTLEGLAVPVHVDAILFAETEEEEAGDPDLVGSLAGAFTEDLEFPLTHGHFGVDAFVVDAGVEAEVEVLVHDGAADVSDVLVADTAVVSALRLRITALGEAKDVAVFFEEIFLLKSKPGVVVIEDAGAGVGGMRISIGEHHFAHDENAIFASSVGIECDRLQDAVGVTTVSLLGGGAVEAPLGKLLKGWEIIKFLDAAFRAEVWDGRVAVQPDVIESVFSHWFG